MAVARTDGKIVDDASFTLKAGEMTCLIGPNGAGKSTLLKAALGLREKSAGTIWLNNEETSALQPQQLARKIAYLPQDPQVEWALSVQDIVALGRHPWRPAGGNLLPEEGEIIDHCLREVDLFALKNRKFTTLSGGEKARVLLARALAVQAAILLIDEPLASLDPYHQLHVMHLLKKRAQAGNAVLVVLHDLTLACRFFDQVLLMSEGKIVETGPPEDVLTPEILEKIYQVRSLCGQYEAQNWILPWSQSDGKK